MGFRLEQKSMTLNVNTLLCRQCYVYYDQTAQARILQFSLESNAVPQLSLR